MCDPIVRKTTSCEDTEATVTLQVEITQEGFSESIQEYTKSKEQQHEECFENMRTELKSVSSATDKELIDLTEILKEEMDLLDAKMYECFSGEITGIEQWSVVQGKVNNISQRIKTLLEEFDLDLTNLEKTRCENIKRVLGQNRNELVHNIRFLSLESIEHIFEDIIADLNSGTLVNLTHHEDLKLKFRIDGEAITSKHHLALRCRASELADERANELWGKVKTEQVKGLVAEVISNLEESNSKTKEDLDQAINSLVECLPVLAEALEIPKTEDNNEEFLKNLMKALELNFETVNTCYLNVDEQLESTITNLEESFDNETKALVLRLQDDFGGEIIKEFSLELAALENKKAEELVVLQFWQKVLKELARTLNKNKPFSLDVILFWHNNLSRLSKARLDLEANFESSHQRCLKKEQELSSKVKTQIKALREAPDKTKVDSFSKILTEIFMGLSNMWSENFEFSNKTIEEFKNKTVWLTIQQTTSEANYFLLQKYPKNLWDSLENVADSDLERNDLNSLAFKCIDCIDLIEKKTLFIYEDLEKYVPVCEYEISEEYDSLLNDVTECVNDKNEKIFAELNSKIQNFENIKKIRLAELEIHSERLKSHQAGVNMILNNVTTTYEEIKSDQKLKLKEFQDSLTNFHETHETETRDQINSAISALEQEWNSLSILLENRILDAKMISQHKFETLKHSNDSFQKIAKHFKNGGNFSQNELTTLTKELKQLEKIFSSQSKTLSDQYNSLIKDISRQELDPIIKILQDKLNVVLLNDKIEEILFLTRMKLRSEISKSKTLENTFISRIQFLNSMGKLDDNLLDEMFSLACSILDDMAFTVPLECEQIPHKTSSPKPSSKKDLGAISKKSVKNSLVPKSLFASVTVEELKDGTNFLSRVKLIISEKYLALIQIIEDTLRKKSVEGAKSNKSKKKEPKQDAENGSITEKIEIITQVLNSYNKECESIWFNQAKEFIRQLTALRMTIKDLSEHILDETHSGYLGTLTRTETEHKLMALKILTEGTSELNKIRKSVVLPLAHPSYQHKLDEIYQQAKSVTGSKIKAHKELVCNYQSDLQKKHDEYVEKMTFLRETLEKSQKTFFDTISCDELAEKLQGLENVMLNQPIEVEKENTDLRLNQLTEAEKENTDLGLNQLTDVEKEGTDEQTELIKTENEETECPKYPMSIWYDDETDCPKHIARFSEVEPVEKNSIITMATSKLKDSVERIQRLYENSGAEAKESEKEIYNCMRNLEYDINQAKLMYTKISK